MSPSETPIEPGQLLAMIQSLQAQLEIQQAEITRQQEQISLLSRPQTEPLNQPDLKTNVRRVTRRRLAAGLLGGLAAGLVTSFRPAQARTITNPPINGSTSDRIGVIGIPPGFSYQDSPPASAKYGVVGGSSNPFSLTNLPVSDAGVVGAGGDIGVFGTSPHFGVYGNSISAGGIGVYGKGGQAAFYANGEIGLNSATYGLEVFGALTGIYTQNATNYGVYSVSLGTGVYAEGNGAGINGPGLMAVNNQSRGIALIADNGDSTDATVLFGNNGGGDFLKCFKAGNPVIRFDASGKGFFNNGTQTGGADLAEFIPIAVQERLEPGDVVEIDPTQPGLFRRASLAKSSSVAGVVSTRPGVTLGAANPAEGEQVGPQLALAGRVPVKVSGQNGPISPGDLLVAASEPGHAMRAGRNPKVGSVVGKALDHFKADRGVIEMLVMLR